MAAELVVTARAHDHIVAIYDWYETQQAGLGEPFLRRLDVRMESLRLHPEMHAVVFENYRQAFLGRFPYMILYVSSGNTVTVHGVFHTARDSNDWRQSLPE